jgi:predicted DCC family thiol-disulfide oxidoreductase YuxK
MTLMDFDYEKHSIVLYDGDCSFCQYSVNFIIKRDPKAHFKFASLQSDIGLEIINKYALTEIPDSLILFKKRSIYYKSKAALLICKNLNHIWKLGFLIIPSFLLDPIYDLIARHRKKLIKSSCLLPSKDINDRFIS